MARIAGSSNEVIGALEQPFLPDQRLRAARLVALCDLTSSQAVKHCASKKLMEDV